MSPIHAPQLVQGNTYSRVPWRLSRSDTRAYDRSSSCNIATHHQGISETSSRSRLYDQPTVSLISTYSGLSSSGSSNTQEPSPLTPDFHPSHSPDITLESHDETPVTPFLSDFCDPDNDANVLVRSSGRDVKRRDLLWERGGKSLRNKRLPELPLSCVADYTSQGEENPTETSVPMPLGRRSSPMPTGIGKSRRFCRDFREPSRSNPNLIHDEISSGSTEGLRATHSPPSLTFPLKNDLLPPPSGSDVSKLFSEKETAAVREFLRVWGSNNRAKASRSKSGRGKDEAPGGCGDGDDYSWEAADAEDSAWDSTQCSMLLQEVGEMVGLPPEQSMELAISSTPPAFSTLDRLAHNGQGISQSSDFPSSYRSAALARSSTNISNGDDFDFDVGVSPSVCRHVDQPLDVAPQAPVTCDLFAGRTGSTSTRGGQDELVTSNSMDVPIILASSPDTTFLKDSSFLNRQLSPGRVRSTSSDRRRRGQIFNVEETKVPVTFSAAAVHLERTFVPIRESPLPPLQPTLSAKHASALDFSLSKLKAHGSQHWKSSGTGKADARENASEKYRGPPLSTTTRERKYQSGVTTRAAHPRSAHGRHFSNPMPVPTRPLAPQPATELTYTHLRERAAKLFPFPENQESSMRSFMEMDVAPPKVQAPRRTSILGRVATRCSQSLANFGKHFIGSRGIKNRTT